MRSHRSLIAAVAVAAVAAVPAVPSLTQVAPRALDALCASSIDGATALVTDMPTVAPRRSMAVGTEIVVVTDPSIAPGIPTALLARGNGVCTVDAFNSVVAAVQSDAGTLAATFASVAAMPWLGEVEVRDLAIAGDTITLTTFGGRHNVTSDWTITVDALGIRSASFETTGFGTQLDSATIEDLEGVTSLPGHARSWTRDATGRLEINATIADDLQASWDEREAASHRAAEMVGKGPGDFLEHTFSDGLTIRLSYGIAATPVETVKSGVAHADRLMNLADGIKSLYDDYMSWGVRDPFENTRRTFLGSQIGVVADTAGYVNIDSGLSAYCLACAYLTDAVEIHMAFVFPDVAPEVVGASYPDREAFFVDVMGHELVHSLQGGYSNGAAGALTNAFNEATARAAEALFDGSANTFQNRSIAYLDNGNGCEGFDNGRGGWIAAQASGPFLQSHTYDSCYFWWTYYAEHGPEGLVALLEALPATLADRTGQNAASLNLELLDRASATGDGTIDLARWAAAYTAGSDADGYTITGANGVAQDWYSLLKPFAARDADLQLSPVAGDVSNGGTRGFHVKRSGAVTTLPTDAEAFLFQVVAGELQLVGPATIGTPVVAGQILAVVAPGTGTFAGSVDIS